MTSSLLTTNRRGVPTVTLPIKRPVLPVPSGLSNLAGPTPVSFLRRSCHSSRTTSLTRSRVKKRAAGKAQQTLADRVPNLNCCWSRRTNSQGRTLCCREGFHRADVTSTIRVPGANSPSMIRQSPSHRKVKCSKHGTICRQ